MKERDTRRVVKSGIVPVWLVMQGEEVRHFIDVSGPFPNLAHMFTFYSGFWTTRCKRYIHVSMPSVNPFGVSNDKRSLTR